VLFIIEKLDKIFHRLTGSEPVINFSRKLAGFRRSTNIFRPAEPDRAEISSLVPTLLVSHG
jgi:hypothetical protein